MNIHGKIVTLRAIERSDLPLLHEWANSPMLQDAMGDIHFPTPTEWHEAWFDRIQNDQNNLRLAICTHNEGLIGISTIINIDWRNRHAWHGIFLGDKEIRGKGIGKDAVFATMRYAFDELGLVRLDGQMIEYNTSSIAFYEKCGWLKEGEKTNYWFRRGRFWKQVIFGITKRQYESTNYWNE